MPQAIVGQIADSFEPKIKSYAAEENINFGLGVVAGSDLEKTVQLPNIGQNLVFSGPLVTDNAINMDINGVAISEVSFAVDNLTTLNFLATEIALNENVASAVVSGTDTIIVTNSVGSSVDITNALVTGGAGQATITVNSVNNNTFRGVAALDQSVQQDSSGNTYYATNATVNVLSQGTVWVIVNGTVAPDDDVAIVVSDDSTKGRFISAAGVVDTGSVINGAKFRSAADVGEIAKIEFNLPV